MHRNSVPTIACLLIAAALFLVTAPGLSQPIVPEAAESETERLCTKTADAAPELSPDGGRVDIQDPLAKLDAGQSARSSTELATFGMGCFWGAEADFCVLDGVVNTIVGYAAGHTANPRYRQVSSGTTGHAEVVRVEYDPSKISYESLLDVFWTHHDPTTANRQGPDIGTQYRSLILFHSPQQQAAALESKRRYSSASWSPIVTGVIPATLFYPAEEYHQDYLERRGRVRCRR